MLWEIGKSSDKTNEGSSLLAAVLVDPELKRQRRECERVSRRYRSHHSYIGNSFSDFGHLRERGFGGRYKQQGNSKSFASDSHVSLSLPLQGSENLTYGAVTESPSGEPSASELNRQLTNPVSSLWSISNQFNNFELNNGQWNNNWNFQPVLPVGLTKDWNLITRPVMPFYNIVPHETSPGEFARDAGLGDLALLELLSPAHSGN